MDKWFQQLLVISVRGGFLKSGLCRYKVINEYWQTFYSRPSLKQQSPFENHEYRKSK